MSAGMPMPTTAKMIWNASDTPICERAAKRSRMKEQSQSHADCATGASDRGSWAASMLAGRNAAREFERVRSLLLLVGVLLLAHISLLFVHPATPAPVARSGGLAARSAVPV